MFPTGLSVDPKLDDKPYEATNPDEAWIKQTFDAKVSVGVGVAYALSCKTPPDQAGPSLPAADRLYWARGARACSAEGSSEDIVGAGHLGNSSRLIVGGPSSR